ncbi:hypothetical protein Hanom_Chr07g00611651 [Helianthus anomalus]
MFRICGRKNKEDNGEEKHWPCGSIKEEEHWFVVCTAQTLLHSSNQ